MNRLLPLLRLALWGTPLPSGDLAEMSFYRQEDWDSLLSFAREQTVIGLLYRAVDLLPDEVEIPSETLLQLIGAADWIRRGNRSIARVSEPLLRDLREQGFHPVVLKGSVCAARYPQPELRESGDIDLYLPPGEFDAAVGFLEKDGRSMAAAPDRSCHFSIDGIDIDLHRHYFDLHVRKDRLPPIPSPEAELLMLSAHIRKHAMGTGVGLRQCCDFATAAASCQIAPESLICLYQRTGTFRWNRLLYAFLEEAFHLPSPLPKTDSAPLRKIVLQGGNFGHHASSRNLELQAAPLRRKAGTARRLLGNLPFSLRYAPREAFPMLWVLARGNLK